MSGRKTSIEVPGNSEDVDTIGCISNEVSYDAELRVMVGVGTVVMHSDKNLDVGVCEKESGRKAIVDAPGGGGVVAVAGLGAIERCFAG